MPMPSGSPWYRTGTVNVTNGSVNLVFTDTLLTLNGAPGDIFKGPDGKDYELDTVADDTHATLKTAYLGATLAAQSYAIVRNFANVNVMAAVAAGLSALFTKYHTTMDQLVSWLTGSGTVALSDGVGNTYNVQTPTALQAALHGRLSKSVAGSTATINLTSAEAANRQIVLTGARTAALTLTVPDGTTGDFYVDNQTTGGYDTTIKTVSGTGLVVKPGKGMTPLAADGTNVIVPNVNTASGLSVGNGTGALAAGTVSATTWFGAPGNGGGAGQDVTLKAGFGTGAAAGNLYLAAGRGNSGGTTGSILFGYSQATDAVGLDTTWATLNAYGNFALGGAPSAWDAGYKALQNRTLALFGTASRDLNLSSNTLVAGDYKYIEDGYATYYSQYLGAHSWHIAGSGTAGNIIPFITAMMLDATVDGAGWNAAATGLRIAKTTSTGRSVNAAGTINASGADYAEYIHKAIIECLFAKGALLGFDADGKITDKWSAAVSGFGVKSTNPNLVGGDVWGASDQVGERPTEPTYTAPTYDGSADPGPAPVAPQFVLPAEPVRQDGESDETFAVFVAAWRRQCVGLEADFAAATEQHQQALASWQAAGAQYRIDQQAHAARVATAEAAHAALMEVYQQHKLAFEDRLEQARQSVDRVAFSGLVPINVQGAQPGDYILAAEGDADTIIGVVVTKAVMAANMTHYLDAVGRVRRVLPDGRAEVAVIVH